jgi:hypothetical protein
MGEYVCHPGAGGLRNIDGSAIGSSRRWQDRRP